MKVALDARTMQVIPTGGIGRILANLIPHLRPSVELVLLLDAGRPGLDIDVEQVALPTPLDTANASWLQWSAARWLRQFDGVFHCPFYGLPFRCPVPGVVTLHDLSYEHFPKMFTRRQGVSFRVQSRHAAKTAAAILADSEFVKSDIVSTYNVDPREVLVAPPGVDRVFTPEADPSAELTRLSVRRPYVVALGGAARRNLTLAIEAWDAATSQHDLVVVGTEDPGQRPGLHWAGPVDDVSWAGLLAGAEAFLYPTSYEGFGMPGLEALGAGVPVVATRNSALPEVLGDAPAWADDLTIDDLARALVTVLDDAAEREARRAASRARALAAPGWDASAEAHLEAYTRAWKRLRS